MTMIVDQFEYAEFNGGIHFFCLRTEINYFGKFGPKGQNFQFQPKFGSQSTISFIIF